MEFLARHTVLVEGRDSYACKSQVMNFFERTSLLHYDSIIIEETILTGNDQVFTEELDRAILRNKKILQRFIDELASTGFETRSDLAGVAQGYHSKVIHIIAHFLDGFIGIDSAFYNMVEDSHWVSNETRNQITRTPERFQLLFLQGYSTSPTVASLLHP